MSLYICRMIETYCPAVHDELVKIGANSKGGRGGMTAKMQAAWMAAQQGVTTIIANGKASDSLLSVRAIGHRSSCSGVLCW